MLAQSSLGSGFPHWQTLAIALIGVVAAGLTLWLGSVLAGRWRGRFFDPHGKGAAAPRGNVAHPDPFVYGSATEKRTALRRRGNSIKVLISDLDAQARPTEGWILDRSVGGLCLQVEGAEVPVGTILSVLASNAPAGTPWTQVEVRSSRQEGNSWELGCQFVKTPPWNVLLLFG
jgi:hypothetical protein